MELHKISRESSELTKIHQIVVLTRPGSSIFSQLTPKSRLRSNMPVLPEGLSPIDMKITPL